MERWALFLFLVLGLVFASPGGVLGLGPPLGEDSLFGVQWAYQARHGHLTVQMDLARADFHNRNTRIAPATMVAAVWNRNITGFQFTRKLATYDNSRNIYYFELNFPATNYVIQRINTKTKQVYSPIDLGASIVGVSALTVDQESGIVYAVATSSSGTHGVYFWPPPSSQGSGKGGFLVGIPSSFQTLHQPISCFVDPSTHSLYLLLLQTKSEGPYHLLKVDLQTRTLSDQGPFYCKPEGYVLHHFNSHLRSDGKAIVGLGINHPSGGILNYWYSVDLETRECKTKKADPHSSGATPEGVGYSPKTNTLYAAMRGACCERNAIAIFSTDANSFQDYDVRWVNSSVVLGGVSFANFAVASN